MAPAIFGITNDGVNLAVNLIVLSLVVVWLALIYWTYVDARRRLDDPVLIWCAVAAACFPFIGAVVYSIVRPAEYLEDVQERELEIQASELRLRELEASTCPSCRGHVQPSYLVCPSCAHRLKHACPSCARPVSPGWRFCPYCESPVAGDRPDKPRRKRVPAAKPKAARQPQAARQRSQPAPAAPQAQAQPAPQEPAPDEVQTEIAAMADQPDVDAEDEAERRRRRAEREARRTRSQAGPQ